MKIFTRILSAWRNLFRRRKLSLRNSSDNRVEWYTHISPVSIFLALVSFVVLTFIVVLTLVGYTPILEVLPNYRSDISRSREIMVENILRIDSMERVINDMMLYNDNIALIMEGRTPVVRSSQINDSLQRERVMVQPNAADSALRAQMEGEGEYSLRRAELNNSTMLMVAPVEGEITQHFDLSQDRKALRISTPGKESKVQAIGGGVVIFSLWSPDGDYMIGVQHPKGMISIYKMLSQSLVESGDIVRGGGVIGYTQAQLPFELELWENGVVVNPENYIIF
ncbi:MAG: M23 family metallopeptidase [Rikenellaceae bacterium]